MGIVLVTGGTGTLGREVVSRLRRAWVPVRVLSRRPQESDEGVEYVVGELANGDGVEAAVAGVEVVVHLAGGANAKGDDVMTRRLVEAARRAGVRHMVVISVTGADGVPLRYPRTKFAVERIVAESGVPWTVLRAAQFHGLMLTVARAMAKLPVIPVPTGMRAEPVDARDVAERLVELVQGEPAGMAPDIAGPAAYGLDEVIRDYLRAGGKRRVLLKVRVPGKVGRAYRQGRNLARPGATRGTRTWPDYLAEQAGGASPQRTMASGRSGS